MRSFNTSLIALLPVAGLLFVGSLILGVGTIKDLALILFVGLASGRLLLALPRHADRLRTGRARSRSTGRWPSGSPSSGPARRKAGDELVAAGPTVVVTPVTRAPAAVRPRRDPGPVRSAGRRTGRR